MRRVRLDYEDEQDGLSLRLVHMQSCMLYPGLFLPTGDQSLVTWSEKQLCEVCEDKMDAVKRCIECEQNFCQACSKVGNFH